MFRSPRQAPTYLSETASFKQYLDYYTQRAGLTENKLALFSRLNQSTLNKIANGKMQNVSVPMLVCICLALGLNEVEAVDLMARRERALSPANETHKLYLDLIRMYSSEEIDCIAERHSERLLEAADRYLESANKETLPNANL